VERHRELHDKLMAMRANNPDLAEAVHDSATCQFCSTQGGSVAYSDEDVARAVSEATASLLAELAELRQNAQTSEVDALVAAAKEESAKEIEELRTQLDLAVLKAEKVTADFEDFKAELERVEAEKAAKIAFDAKREERLQAVKEVAAFTEERLLANADRWAGMSDEEFASLLEDYKAVSPKPTVKDAKVPAKTALVASRDLGLDSHDPDGKELYQRVMQASLQDRRNHPRTF